MFVGAALATSAVAPFDGTVQHAMVTEDVHDVRVLHAAANGFAFLGGPGPFVGGAALYLLGRSTQSNHVAALGVTLTEGVVLAAGLNGLVKGFSGRALPNATTTDPGDFSFGRGFHDHNGAFVSFPSGHTAASFAAASVIANTVQEWSPSAARIVGPVAYTTATLVAVSRLYQNVHWASDLPLGAVIGIWSGRTVVAWQHRHHNNWLSRHMAGLIVVPSGHGLTITEIVRPRQ
jgi:membrane-associated phospholipid phosphatase